jgi:hypothetical protein
MAYRVNSYQPTPTVIFNPRATLRLPSYNADILAASLGGAAGQKLVKAGSIFCTDGKQLKRAKLLTDGTSGDTGIYVNNPWAFAPGDVLKVVAPLGSTAAAELAAITAATGAAVGTIQSIESAIDTQTSRITPAAAIVGNIITVDFQGIAAAYVVKTAVLADELIGLAKVAQTAISSSESTSYVSVTAYPTYVEIKCTSAKTIVEFAVSIAQGTGASLGTVATSTIQGLGKLILAAPLAATLPAGTKVGTLDQIPQAIWDNEWDFGNYPHAVPLEHAITPCYGGQFYLNALPYFDAQVAKMLPQAAFIPAVAS